jgi:hypothetical protein
MSKKSSAIKKNRKKKKIAGYISKTIIVNEKQIEYLKKIVKDYNLTELERKFIAHVYNSNKIKFIKFKQYKEINYNLIKVPISFKLINEIFGRNKNKFDKNKLINSGIIIISEPNWKVNVCTYYALKKEIFFELMKLDLTENDFEYIYNLYDMKKFKFVSSKKKDKDSDILNKVIETYKKNLCLINYTKAKKMLINGYLKSARKDIDNNIMSDKVRRFLINKTAIKNIIANHKEKFTENNDIYLRYKQRFSILKTGRIQELGTGMMGCTESLKHAAFINNKVEINNYDLESAHVYIMIKLVDFINEFIIKNEDKINKQWLEEYLSRDKIYYVSKLGLNNKEELKDGINLWKKLLYSIFFGGGIRKTIKINKNSYFYQEYETKENQAYRSILDYSEIFNHDPDIIWNKFIKIIKPFYLEREKLMNNLIDNNILNQIQSLGNNSDLMFKVTRFDKNVSHWCYKNSVGKKKIKDSKSLDENKFKRQLMAHIIQGYESLFISNIVLLGCKYNYKPISHQHDGLITIGEIPEYAIKEAIRKTGFDSAKLIKKSFENKIKIVL